MSGGPTIVEIYTDGACSGNPGPGGWGAILRYGENEKELSGGAAEKLSDTCLWLDTVQRFFHDALHPCARAHPERRQWAT